MLARPRRPQARLAPGLLLDMALLAAIFAAFPLPAGARVGTSDPAATCLAVADRAADAHAVPRAVMRALTRTETGRTRDGALQPWAWTVNMEGAGRWFDSRDEALAYVRKEQARGAVSFDVGCFQINFKWHGKNFDSVEAMFDPSVNADYAARFMRELFDEGGSWPKAAGWYHSRTPEFFNRYRERFARILARGDGDTGAMDVAALDAAGAPPPQDRAPRPDPAAKRAARPAAVIWRAAEAPPASAGAVSIRVLRGGLAPLAGARRPLID